MESLQLFLDQFQPSGEAESLWLQQMFSFVSDHLSGPAPPADDTSLTGVYQLSVYQLSVYQLSVCCVAGVYQLSVCCVAGVYQLSVYQLSVCVVAGVYQLSVCCVAGVFQLSVCVVLQVCTSCVCVVAGVYQLSVCCVAGVYQLSVCCVAGVYQLSVCCVAGVFQLSVYQLSVCCVAGVYQLSVCVVKQLQQSGVTHSLPVSYRPVCVSELLSRQHLSCFSHLSWSTNQHRAWVREAELSAPGQVLPRVSLLLIGCLREGRDGEWRLTDSSGSVRCECLSPSPLWLNRPVFLPHWNYIPHHAPGSEEAGGWVELIGPPVVLCPGAEQGLVVGPEEGAGLSKAVGVKEAADFLKNR
ncbi:CST complex subunit CTC1 [Dissostichus eleginoides]|uniref:CST complex subunit CTC1 n=1 Tax=Dissostichus eleginoides TaxID=100907 RepID=A0AAD9B4P4_DISEL|nr:CST complex subunit CTC1 [Dissostichus eleginoides]